MDDDQEAFRWVVHGRVQGVGFRWFTRRAAQQLGLRGWVRNLPDGCVEIQLLGTHRELAAFEQQVRRGPTGSRVDRLDQEPIDGATAFDPEFQIIR